MNNVWRKQSNFRLIKPVKEPIPLRYYMERRGLGYCKKNTGKKLAEHGIRAQQLRFPNTAGATHLMWILLPDDYDLSCWPW